MNKYSKGKVFKYIGFFITALCLVSVDQFTKYLAVKELKYQKPYTLIQDILLFRYLENPGAAWGILGGKRILFMSLTFIVIIMMFLLIIKIEMVLAGLDNKKAGIALQWVLAVLISGALGNLIDRIRLGYVVDFIYFKPIDFPTFNVADCYVTVSTAILLFLLLAGINGHDWDMILSFKNSGGGKID